MNEEWKTIEGSEGYEISNLGRVRSFWTIGRYAKIGRSEPVVLALSKDKDGYEHVGVRRGNRRVTKKVHRLVLRAFHGPCPPQFECRHKNGNRSDNRSQNLRWGSKVSNQKDRIRHGTSQHGERHQMARLTADQVVEIRKLAAFEGVSRSDMAATFGVSESHIRNIIIGHRWSITGKEGA